MLGNFLLSRYFSFKYYKDFRFDRVHRFMKQDLEAVKLCLTAHIVNILKIAPVINICILHA